MKEKEVKVAINFTYVVIGIIFTSVSFPLIFEPIVYDAVINNSITLLGYLRAVFASAIAFIGFILAHRGLTGEWL
ncbi:MAG: hypothetical protein PHW96_02015 [Candidatus Nanoarchaeia archaeon]|nr:hypothetical protein [Candidatus Nanoarchaeia archaeon]